MTVIYSLNSLVNHTHNNLCNKHKLYLYQNLNYFMKKSITSLSKIKFYLYKKIK